MGYKLVFNPIQGKLDMVGGGSAVDLSPVETRITTLENNEFKVAYSETISATTGTITKHTASTIKLTELPGGLSAFVETIASGEPTGYSPETAGGVPISVTSFDASGNDTLSGIPSSYPVALIYIITIPAISWSNLTEDNILEFEKAD